MAFKSLSEAASSLGRGGQPSFVSALQSKKKNGMQELTFRLNAIAMEKIGVAVGSKIDVLRDEEEDLWMIKKMPDGNGGLTLSGQANKAGSITTAAVRIVLRPGMPRLAEEDVTDEDGLKKRFSEDESAKFEDGALIFRLKQ